jgi:hypothetical protein
MSNRHCVGRFRSAGKGLRTASVQLASSFLTLVTPPTVGHVGLNIRYLQRSGVSTATAGASVAVSQGVTVVVTVVGDVLAVLGVPARWQDRPPATAEDGRPADDREDQHQGGDLRGLQPEVAREQGQERGRVGEHLGPFATRASAAHYVRLTSGWSARPDHDRTSMEVSRDPDHQP